MIIFLFLVLLAGTQTCTIPAPGPGWVCQDGGWLPPGHPQIRPPTPAPPALPTRLTRRARFSFGASTPVWPPAPTEPGPNASIIEAAKRGIDLPPGEVYFTPPLRLRDIARLRGTAGRTVLKPNTPTGGPLVIIETTSAGDYAIEYPIRQIVEGIRIACLNQYRPGSTSRRRHDVAGCHGGWVRRGADVSFGVNIAVRDSLFVKNRVALMLLGQGPPRPVSRPFVSRAAGFAARRSMGRALATGSGSCSTTRPSSKAIQGRRCMLSRRGRNRGITVLLRDVWFEANGTDVTDPPSLVTIEGLRQRYGHVRSGAHRVEVNPWTRSRPFRQASRVSF